MLNRLFIVVGVIAIALIAAGFVVPSFVDWSGYRERIETIGAEVLGTDVAINGDIDVSFLPQPRLSFADVVVGPTDVPLVEITRVEAEFSLLDFLRDRYAITRLLLAGPRVSLRIDETGHFSTPVRLPEAVSASNVSVADADIVDGVLQVIDQRSGDIWQTEGFDGSLQMAGLRGPFSLQGTTVFDAQRFDARFNTSAMNLEGVMQATVFVRPTDGGGSLSLEGILETDVYPAFKGAAVFRQSPGASENANTVSGDLVFNSEVEINASQILFSNYTIEPDENRPATRLTGAAVVNLGEEPEFDAVISGGVLALNARDALIEDASGPYELVRLLAELPTPFLPPIPGRVGIDISELDVRAFSLRDLRIDARSNGAEWSISTLEARMAGNTMFSLTGVLGSGEDGPVFDGALKLDSTRLDALAQGWRRPAENNPLFNMPGSLEGRLTFSNNNLSLDDARFVLDDVTHRLSFDVETGNAPQLGVMARFGVLNDLQSRALEALLPDFDADPDFGLTFPIGNFDVQAERIRLFGFDAVAADVTGSWEAGRLNFDQLAVDDFGGARLDMTGFVGGNLLAPRLSGVGQISFVEGAQSGVLPLVLDALNAPSSVRDLAPALVPAELSFDLTGPGESDGQDLTLKGRAGVTEVDLVAFFSGGLLKLGQSPLNLQLDLKSGQPLAFNEQFGLGSIALVPEDGPIAVSLIADGTPSNSVDVDLGVSGSTDSSQFTGNVILSDISNIRGHGSLDFSVSDLTPFAQIFGADGLGFGAVSGRAEISFAGGESIDISNIDVTSGDTIFSGEINRTREGDTLLFAGDLRASALDVSALAGLLGGASSLVSTGDIWPNGPFGFSEDGRTSRGRLSVATPFVRNAGRDMATDARFDFVWDATNTRIRGLVADLGSGQIGLEVGVCCTGLEVERQVTGRLTLSDVAMDTLLPAVPGTVLDGAFSGGVSFTGGGSDYADVIANLGGEGSFAISDFSIEEFDPVAFERVAAADNVLELEPDELTVIVRDALAEGAFISPSVGGVFSIAGGALRLSNIAAEGEQARLFGDMNIRLDDLAVEGDWTLTPTEIDDPDGLVSAITAQVTALISGTLIQPDYQLDLGPMIDAIKVRAFEIEVDRLEAQQALEEERARVAAEERALLMEQQAQERIEAELAEAEAAAQRARDEEAQRILNQIAEELSNSRDPVAVNPGVDDAPIDLVPSEPFSIPEPIFENDASLF